ncbi:MAG: hypothetical protein IT177_11640 [Acidobacteria bacterium]|nr:hypothetical protein [Acidobacteriota bacterium]
MAVDPLAALAARLDQFEARLAALEGERSHEPDEDDGALLGAIAEHIGRPFQAHELLALRALSEDTNLLLDDLGIMDTAGAGYWLRRMAGRGVYGLRLLRGRRGPTGVRWRVVADDDHDDAHSTPIRRARLNP